MGLPDILRAFSAITGRFGSQGSFEYFETSQTLRKAAVTVAFIYGSLQMHVQTIVRSGLFRRASHAILGLTAIGALFLLGGCDNYNPYLGATPTVSSSITSITPSGTTAGHGDILITVNGSGFAANSNVTWNSSNSASTNLVSNVVSGTQMQANIPASLLATPGTFFVGVIAPGPTAGNNAGNNISNFVPFMVCGSSGCPSVVPSTMAKFSTLRPGTQVFALSAAIQAAQRYQAFAASAVDGSIDTGTGITRIFLRDSCFGASGACARQGHGRWRKGLHCISCREQISVFGTWVQGWWRRNQTRSRAWCGSSKEDASLFSYALYLLAKWREPRAYPQVIGWLSLPDEEPFAIAGDVVT